MDSFNTAQRRSTRYAVQVNAVLTFRTDGEPLENTTLDLGVEGAAFTAWHEVHVGDGVILCLHFGNERFECKGQVRWVRTFPGGERRFGIRFVDLFDDEKRELCDFLHAEGQAVRT